MSQPKRKVIDGMPMCSKCHHPRPPHWYSKDSTTPLGIGYQCRKCRQSNNKCVVNSPDVEVIPVSKVKTLVRAAVKMEEGSWERVVRRAAIATAQESVCVHVGSNYYSHYSAYVGVLEAARRLKLKVTVQHGKNEIYLTARATGERAVAAK